MKSALAIIPLLLLAVGYISLNYNKGDPDLNLRPIIAVMAQPDSHHCKDFGDYTSYIAASYVKFAESLGARVVPIPYDADDEDIFKLIDQVDGALFPGGASGLVDTDHEGKKYVTRYLEVQEFFFNASLSKKALGVNFPIFAICLGFEATGLIVMDDKYRDGCSAPKVAVKQTLIDPDNSRLFKTVPDDLRTALENEEIVYENHEHCISMDHYNKTQELQDFFQVTSSAVGSNGVEYVNSWEAINFPIYGFQYHPEKALFEWTKDGNIPHTPDAVNWTQFLADFFGTEVRQSTQTFLDSTVEEDALIYNYTAYFEDSYYEQIYCF